MKVLSIDFDYFINATMDIRNNIFPNGCDEMDIEELKSKWEHTYSEHSEVCNIKVIDTFFNFLELIKSHSSHFEAIQIDNSHKYIHSTLEALRNETVEVLNIDFHHDMYHLGGDTVNCSNWARLFLEHNNQSKYVWCMRDDSDTRTLFGEVECEKTTDLIGSVTDFLKGDEPIICFVCFSPEWTPPHLLKEYNMLLKALEYKG